MNREFKFRAWGASEQSEWENKMQYSFDIETDGEIFYGGDAYPEWILMQYTGLKDKNGKEIFEGDIVKYQSSPNYPHYAVVGFGTGCFIATFQSGTVWKLHLRVEAGDEVIGNIYEHERLLNE